MSDTATKKRIVVRPGDEGRLWFFVDLDQIDDAKRVLAAAGIRHWVGHTRTSIRNEPFSAMFHTYPGHELEAVQRVLDEAE